MVSSDSTCRGTLAATGAQMRWEVGRDGWSDPSGDAHQLDQAREAQTGGDLELASARIR